MIYLKMSKIYFGSFTKGMNEFNKDLIFIINSVVLLIVYVLFVGITSIIARVFKKHFLHLNISANIDTYWTSTKQNLDSSEDYFKQF